MGICLPSYLRHKTVPMGAPYQIIIADDHAVVRTGLQLILDETSDLSITGEARTGDELLQALRNQPYDIAILDISMPGRDSFDVLVEIKKQWPAIPVVIFTMNPDDVHAVRMLRAGASAYVNKETSAEIIIEVLRRVVTGRKYIFSHQAEFLANITVNSSHTPTLHEVLTDREFQIFFMLASGLRKTNIADKLAISKHTISNHRNNILKKMNISSNSELTRYALQHGIIK